MNADRFTLRIPSSQYAEVARQLPVPRCRLGGALGSVDPAIELDGGRFELDAPFAATDTWAGPAWLAAGRLVAHGPRTARFARVELEANGWSSAVSELRLRPVSRRFTLWGNRRQRRDFALAHQAVDRLVSQVTARPPLEVVAGYADTSASRRERYRRSESVLTDESA